MSIVLNTLMQPLVKYLDRKDVMEINANKSGEIWLEIAGQGYQSVQDELLDFGFWQRLSQVISNIENSDYCPIKQPIVNARIPGGHRFEATVGSIPVSKLSVSIRVFREVKFSLRQFGLSSEMESFLIDAVKNEAVIMVSGGTSSGKTTFLNQLIRHIPENNRVLTLEDTQELRLPHKNQGNFIVSRNNKKSPVGYGDVIGHLMRSRPDNILLGEISVDNTYPAMRVLSTGHAGFMCTLHSNSPKQALEVAIPQNIQLSGINPKGITEFLYDSVDVVVQLIRNQIGHRVVTEIMMPKLKKRFILSKDSVESYGQHHDFSMLSEFEVENVDVA